jgi:hypothetical protein
VRLERLGKSKSPPQPGLEPATFRLVAWCNQLRYRVRRGVENIKMDLREIGWDCMDWIDVAQIGSSGKFL